MERQRSLMEIHGSNWSADGAKCSGGAKWSAGECQRSQIERWRSLMERPRSPGEAKWSPRGSHGAPDLFLFLKNGIIDGVLFKIQGLVAAGQVEMSSQSYWTGRNVVKEQLGRSKCSPGAARQVEMSPRRPCGQPRAGPTVPKF